jgi:uncharacterized protein YrzB (UPF0473 family)
MANEIEAGQIFELTDEEGNTFTFELLDFVAVEEELYAVITTVEEEEKDDDEMNVVIMRVEIENKEPIFTLVEDEEVCKNVLEAFISQFEDEEEEEVEGE